MAGWRFLTIRMQSAQLAQWAANRTRRALLKPNPPVDNAKLDKTCAVGDARGVPRMVRKQFHTLAS